MTPEEEQAAINEGMKEQRMISEIALRRTLLRSHAKDTTAIILARYREEEIAAREQHERGLSIMERI